MGHIPNTQPQQIDFTSHHSIVVLPAIESLFSGMELICLYDEVKWKVRRYKQYSTRSTFYTSNDKQHKPQVPKTNLKLHFFTDY